MASTAAVDWPPDERMKRRTDSTGLGMLSTLDIGKMCAHLSWPLICREYSSQHLESSWISSYEIVVSLFMSWKTCAQVEGDVRGRDCSDHLVCVQTSTAIFSFWDVSFIFWLFLRFPLQGWHHDDCKVEASGEPTLPMQKT